MSDPKIQSQVKYNRALAAGRKALQSQAKVNWTLGDLAATVTATYGDKTVKRFATDLDIAPGTVYDYRAVAGAYSEAERSDTTSWTVHQVFMREDDRAELVTRRWTRSEAIAEVAKRHAPAPSDDLETDSDGESRSTDPESLAPAETLESTLAKAEAEVARLEGELVKARAIVAKLRAGMPARPPVTHAPKGMPAHTPADCSAACPMFPKNVSPIKPAKPAKPAPRSARNAA